LQSRTWQFYLHFFLQHYPVTIHTSQAKHTLSTFDFTPVSVCGCVCTVKMSTSLFLWLHVTTEGPSKLGCVSEQSCLWNEKGYKCETKWTAQWSFLRWSATWTRSSYRTPWRLFPTPSSGVDMMSQPHIAFVPGVPAHCFTVVHTGTGHHRPLDSAHCSLSSPCWDWQQHVLWVQLQYSPIWLHGVMFN
jgi:hypothetical protein